MEVLAAAFAEMAGVSQAAVCSKIKNGTLIRNSGGKLDTDNPINRAYLEKHQRKFHAEMKAKENGAAILAGGASAGVNSGGNAAQSAAGAGGGDGNSKKTAPGGGNAKQTALFASGGGNFSQSAAHVSGYSDLEDSIATTRQLIRVVKSNSEFMTIENIERCVKMESSIATALEKLQKFQERRLDQIPKDFVTSRLFSFYDQMMNKLLDVPESVCDQLIAMVRSDTETMRQDVISFLGDNLTRCIAGTKEHVVSELNGLKGKYDRQEEMTKDDVREVVKEMMD